MTIAFCYGQVTQNGSLACFELAIALHNAAKERKELMDVRLLRHFLIILEEKSFSRAGERLGIGQPALGVQMRTLEHEAKQQLLYRHSRGVEATAAGAIFAEHAKDIVQRADDALKAMIDFNETKGTVTIGLLPSAGTVFLSNLVRSMQTEFPSVRLIIKEEMTSALLKGLSTGAYQFVCLYDHGDDRNSGLIMEPLLADHYCFLSTDPSLEKFDTIAFRDALIHKLILPAGALFLRRRLENLASELEIPLQNILEVQSEAQVKELVSKGLGASILPNTSIRSDLTERRYHAASLVEPALSARLSLARRAGYPLSRSAEAVRSCLLRLASSSGGTHRYDRSSPQRL